MWQSIQAIFNWRVWLFFQVQSGERKEKYIFFTLTEMQGILKYNSNLQQKWPNTAGMPLNSAFLQTKQPQPTRVGMACPRRLKLLNLLEDSNVCLQTSNGCDLSLSYSGHQADSLIPSELLRAAWFSKRGIKRNSNVITAPRKLLLKPGGWKTVCVFWFELLEQNLQNCSAY